MFLIDISLPKVKKTYAILARAVEDTADDILSEAITEWKEYLSQAIIANLSGEIIDSRSLRKVANTRNIVVRETSDGFEVYLRQVPSWAYAHEYGATIRPKSGQYLAIPVGPAASAKRRRTPRMYKKTFMIPGTGKADAVMMWRRSRTEAVPIFAMMTEVTLPIRPWFAKSVQEAWPYMRRIIKEMGG